MNQVLKPSLTSTHMHFSIPGPSVTQGQWRSVHPTTLESRTSFELHPGRAFVKALIELLGRHRGDEVCVIWTWWTWEGFVWEELTSCVFGERSRLLGHIDAEGNAAQELVAFVTVEQVWTLHLALDDELRVIVVLHQQQLHGYHRLDVVYLTERRKQKRKPKWEKYDKKLCNNLVTAI